MPNTIKYELRNVLSGKNPIGSENAIQAIANYLRRSQETSALAQTDKHFKTEDTKSLITYIEKNKLWTKPLNFSPLRKVFFSHKGTKPLSFTKFITMLCEPLCHSALVAFLHF